MRYANSTPHALNDVANHAADATNAISAANGSPSKVNFISRYKKKDRVLCDELKEYFKLPCKDFDSCKPVQWWVGRQAQFPSLYCLAWDLLTIPSMFSFIFYVTRTLMRSSPGSAVAVEQVFSGRHNTISLRHASLQPETICTLMLLKQQLRLSYASSIDN